MRLYRHFWKCVILIAAIFITGCARRVIVLDKDKWNSQTIICLKSEDATAYFDRDEAIQQMIKIKSKVNNAKATNEKDSVIRVLSQHGIDTLMVFVEYGLNDSNEQRFVANTARYWVAPLMDRGLVKVKANKTGQVVKKIVRRRMRDNILYSIETGEIVFYHVRSL